MNIDPKQRAKAIDAAISSIERQFGKGSIMRMDNAVDKKIPVISTGSLGIDIALGGGNIHCITQQQPLII